MVTDTAPEHIIEIVHDREWKHNKGAFGALWVVRQSLIMKLLVFLCIWRLTLKQSLIKAVNIGLSSVFIFVLYLPPDCLMNNCLKHQNTDK